MGDDSLVGILFFALIAVFLAHRLWQVLGRRDGDAPRRTDAIRPDPFRPREPQRLAPARDFPPTVQPLPVVNPGDPVSLDTALRQIRAADPQFDERRFVEGAKAAFQIIVPAFAAGNRDALKPLLGEDVYAAFNKAITAREADGQTLETTVARLGASLEAAQLTGDVARITVAFRSGQTTLLRANDGNVLEGAPNRIEDVVDLWTFARDTRSSDPNWMLVETRQA